MTEQTEVINEAKLINSTLRRARQTMKIGVLQSSLAVEVLHEDGAVISETLDNHKYKLKSTLSLTGRRLSKLKNAEELEKYLIYLSLSFFGVVVAYIISKRMGFLSIFQSNQC
eukprot:gene7891-10707_t